MKLLREGSGLPGCSSVPRGSYGGARGFDPGLFLRGRAHGDAFARLAGLAPPGPGLLGFLFSRGRYFLLLPMGFQHGPPKLPRDSGVLRVRGDHSVSRPPHTHTPNFPPGGSVYMISITCNYHGRTIN